MRFSSVARLPPRGTGTERRTAVRHTPRGHVCSLSAAYVETWRSRRLLLAGALDEGELTTIGMLLLFAGHGLTGSMPALGTFAVAFGPYRARRPPTVRRPYSSSCTSRSVPP
ncbi:hypothetical protein ACWDRZ_06580 [Streptomyces sp. NPDC003509]